MDKTFLAIYRARVKGDAMTIHVQSATLAQFLTAVSAQDDDAAEAVVAALTLSDEPALLQLLGREDADVQWWAVRALGACGGVASIAPLLTALESPSAALRSVTVMALGRLAERQPDAMMPHLQRLTTLFADRDGLVRQVAADALAQCGTRAIPVLVEVLRFGADQGARSRAAYALGKIGTLDAAPALFRCLNDPNYLVHTYAYEALDALGLLENLLLQP